MKNWTVWKAVMVLVVLGITPALARAQSMIVLGGTLSWTWQTYGYTCPHQQNYGYSMTQDTSFTWKYGSTTYPVSGSASYTDANGPHPPCPPSGPTGTVQYTVPSGLGFPANCAFTFTPADYPTGSGTITTQNCGSDPGWPNPGTNPIYYSNLQQPASTWQIRDGLNYNTGSTCPNNPSPRPYCSLANVGTPSVSGTSLEDTNYIGACSEFNCLAIRDLCGGNSGQGCPTTPPQHFEFEVSFYLPAGYRYQALEFDPDLTDTNGYTRWASIECDSASGNWQYYDSSVIVSPDVSAWKPFTGGSGPGGVIPCGAYTPSTHQWNSGWYRLRLYVTMQNETYYLVGLYLDPYSNGNPVLTSNLLTVSQGPIGACNGNGGVNPGCANYNSTTHTYTPWPPRMWVEEQLDNNPSSSSPTEKVNYDIYSLIVW